MINPSSITNYNLTEAELEEQLLFWVCAAGKNGVTAAKCLDNLLKFWRPISEHFQYSPSPFTIIRNIGLLPKELKKHGIGCYNNKAKTFSALVNSTLNLKTCSTDDLESIHGIGPKTARCFILHTRKDARVAGLDRHILSFLRGKGIPTPNSTPTGKKYKILEQEFLKLCDEAGKTPATYDLELWNLYRNKKNVLTTT